MYCRLSIAFKRASTIHNKQRVPLQGSCAKSGVTSVRGFSTGYDTVSKHTFQADDEKVGTVGNKQAKVEQLTDASAIGLSHTTNY